MTGILPCLSGKLRRGSEYSCDEIHMGTPWACTGPGTCLTLQTSKSEQTAGFHTAVFMCSHVRRNFSFCGIDLLYNASPLLVIFSVGDQSKYQHPSVSISSKTVDGIDRLEILLESWAPYNSYRRQVAFFLPLILSTVSMVLIFTIINSWNEFFRKVRLRKNYASNFQLLPSLPGKAQYEWKRAPSLIMIFRLSSLGLILMSQCGWWFVAIQFECKIPHLIYTTTCQ